jgi:cytosine/adenosine deaminase-related metal-dependent hydrolase
MKTLFIHHISHLIPDFSGSEIIQNGAIYVENNVITSVGSTEELSSDNDFTMEADTIINGEGLIVLPGLVNTHHHLYQTLTRAIPAAQNVSLFNWLKTLYPIWAKMDAEAVYVSALTGLAELVLSGCTTAADHLYIYPNDVRLDDEIRAAKEIGVRFHASRGSMSLGESQGGLPPDSVVEDENAILNDTQLLIEMYHDSARYSMLQVVVAPCSPFSVTENLMQESTKLARSYGVQLHTHLAETKDEEAFCIATSGMRPVQYAEKLGWVGDDVWFAHGVHINAAEIERLAATQTGIAHCPSSNMRLASGIAPIRAYLDHDVPVGIAVDGSASNDSSHLLAEARMAMLLQRVCGEPAQLSAKEALQVATEGGARVLGRDDIGKIAVGYAADFIGFDMDDLALAGSAVHDPLASLIFCTPSRVKLSVINGQMVVEDGELLTVDLKRNIQRHNQIARNMLV